MTANPYLHAEPAGQRDAGPGTAPAGRPVRCRHPVYYDDWSGTWRHLDPTADAGACRPAGGHRPHRPAAGPAPDVPVPDIPVTAADRPHVVDAGVGTLWLRVPLHPHHPTGAGPAGSPAPGARQATDPLRPEAQAPAPGSRGRRRRSGAGR